MREGPGIDEFIQSRLKYSRSRADVHLRRFDYSALIAIVGSAYFLFGAPGLNGEPLFQNVPYELPLGMGVLGSIWACIRLYYVLGVRSRHNERSAKKVLKDLLGD